MYNPEQKIKFIESRDRAKSSKESFVFFFNRTAPFEEQEQKDLCFLPQEKIISIMEKVSGTRASSRNANLFRAKTYIKWCHDVGIDNMGHRVLDYKEIDWDIAGFKQRMVANPIGLQSFLNSLFEPAEEKTVDNIYRCYFWMAFMGIPEQYVLSIPAKAVNFGVSKLIYNENGYPIYTESTEVFKNCVALDSFVYKNPNYSDTIRNRAKGNNLIRGFTEPKSTRQIKAYISRKIKEKLNEDDVVLSYQRALLSGMFYKARHWEIDHREFPTFIEQAREISINQGTNIKNFEAKVQRMAKGFQEDYKSWKKAFDL